MRRVAVVMMLGRLGGDDNGASGRGGERVEGGVAHEDARGVVMRKWLSRKWLCQEGGGVKIGMVSRGWWYQVSGGVKRVVVSR